ncbi:MAG: alanine racemase [Spirochaetales bacterium]|nr:alanine racemase [Spirochaetales bacterium]
MELKKDILLYNLKHIQNLCIKNNLGLVVVTKCCCSFPELVNLLSENGIDSIADSNYENFLKIEHKMKNILLKTSYSDIKTGLKQTDIVYISDYSIFKKISEIHDVKQIMLTIELGDYKEGLPPLEVIPFIKRARKLKNSPIIGISGNLGCLSGKLPDEMSINTMADLANKIKSETAIKTPIVSLGGTIILDSVISGNLSPEINQIRIGEGIFLGYNSSGNSPVEGLDTHVFTYSAEVIEVREKKIDAHSNFGFNAFGHKQTTIKKGVRRRAVLSAGSLAAPMNGLTPFLEGVSIEGITYDFMVLDVTDCNNRIKTGDFIKFHTHYAAVAQAMINPYVIKKII